MTTKIWQLTALGQSLWYDNIERRLLENGELEAMIKRGDIRGITSNPTIFNNAIAKSTYYDSALIPMSWAGYTDQMILEQLMTEDIKRTADLLRPLFDTTHGADGFVSIEVRPDFAYETDKTIAEAQRLWDIVNRPNLMVKIPATEPGLMAIRRSIAAGININITLTFSIERYKEVMEAYLSGLEDRVNSGMPIDHIHSVASFFVSRIDTKVDKYLEPIINKGGKNSRKAKSLLGKMAIANARLAYQEFRRVFESSRFKKLQKKGGNLQRPLWASTSTKNPAYPDIMYVDELIGAHTINTVPQQTLDAFKDHGTIELTIEKDLEGAQKCFNDLDDVGISMQQVTKELEEEGVKTFSEAFQSLNSTIKQRKIEAIEQLSGLAKPVATRIAQMQADHFAPRFFSRDASLWAADPKGQEEVKIRMGWLSLPELGASLVSDLDAFTAEIKKDGYTHALLMGMGGSSLASEVMSLIYADSLSGLKLTILDSTDPAQVRQAAEANPEANTLYIVSSKSGGTAEVNAMFNYFWQRVHAKAGNSAGEHFIAITDPGTSLEKLATKHGFRRVFLANPFVGGRYSALSAFGLVPAALMGIDIGQLLNCASWMESECSPDQPLGRNPGFTLGAVLGEAYLHGRDKLTLVADRELEPFGAWLEQLVAESSGKQGKGIVPINGEAVGKPELYGNDRIFYYLRRDGKFDNKLKKLRKSGHPVLVQENQDASAIAAEFYKWEMAAATACFILGVNAFDQPDVQDSKNRTVAKISYFQANNKFNEPEPSLVQKGISLYANGTPKRAKIPSQVIKFLDSSKPGDYIGINAYIDRDKKNEDSLQKLREWIMARTKLATTVGFGPRYLHSTGQLHKGGADKGVFLVITADPVQDIEIPDENISFGVLEHGQALGDLEALAARNRRTLWVRLSKPDLLKTLVDQLVEA